MNPDIRKNIYSHGLALIYFFAITFLFFKPEFTDDQSIAQDDIIRYQGVAQQTIKYNKTHEQPTLWTTSMFGGMPVYLFEAHFPDQLLGFFDRIFKGFMTSKSAHMYFMAALCFYLAMLCFGVSPYFAMIGAIAFGLTTYNLVLIDVGHMTKMWAIAYSPLILGGMCLVFRKKTLLGFAVFSLALALQLRSNHLQITYYLAFVCAIYVITEFVFTMKQKEVKSFSISVAVLVLGAILALGANSGRLITTKEYAKYSIRGKSELTPSHQHKDNAQSADGLDKAYAFAWSQGVSETLTLLIPNAYGGSNNETLEEDFETYQTLESKIDPQQFQNLVNNAPFFYWGDQPFTNAPIYAGATVCFLFVLAIILMNNTHRYWLIASVLLTMIFAWGKNFSSLNYFMFDYFPLFNKFRSVSMALSLTVLMMSMGAVMGLDHIAKMKFSEDLKKKLIIAFGLTGGVSLIFFLMGGSLFSFIGMADSNYPDWLLDAIYADRETMLKNDALRSFFFIGVLGTVIFFRLKNKLDLIPFTVIIAAVLLMDVWGVGRRYLNADDFEDAVQERNFSPTPADQIIMKDPDPNYRVLNINNPFQDAKTSYYHKSVGGYFAAKPRRYQDLIEHYLGNAVTRIRGQLAKRRRPNFASYQILNMLNTKYIKIGENEKAVLKNDFVYGDAWFVESIKTVQNPDEEIAMLKNVNLATTAVIDKSKFDIKDQKYSLSSSSDTDSLNAQSKVVKPKLQAKLLEYAPNAITYQTNNPNNGFLVMPEAYYPKGWHVTLDGKPVTHARVNYVLRGMKVPAGKHKIVFSFDPKSYQLGSMLTKISTILITLVVLISLGITLKIEFYTTSKSEA